MSPNVRRDDEGTSELQEPLLEPPEVEKPSFFSEACDLMKLSGPIFMAMSTGVFINGRVLGVFCGNAIGAGNKELAGIWLQVSLAVMAAIALPVMGLWCLTAPVLTAFGEGSRTSNDAAYYSYILMLCIPARVAYGQVNQFFTAQRIMRPSVLLSSFGMVLNLLLGLILVLGVGIKGWNGFGFHACPIVTTAVEYSQLFLLVVVYILMKKLHAECWPTQGWAWKHITRDRLSQYLKMYVPAALGIASDFWRVAAIGTVAATLGETEVGVFNASYRILWMCLTFMGSLAGAVGIKLGLAFGKGDAELAKFTAFVGTVVAVAVLIVLGFIVYAIPRQLGSIFSTDDEVLDLFVEIRIPLAVMMVVMNLSVNLERIPMAMGRTKEVLIMGLVGSWVGQVPGVLLCTQLWRKDLVGLYTGVAAGYALLLRVPYELQQMSWQTWFIGKQV
eukprot:gene14638-17293_t